jgi:hypothetical protein
MLLGQLPGEEEGEADRRGRRETTICVELNQSSSLPLSTMICSAPTQTTSSARPT